MGVFKRRVIRRWQEEVPREDAHLRRWDVVKIATTLEVNGVREYTPENVVIARQEDNRVYVSENGSIMWWVDIDRCIFLKEVESVDWEEVPEMP